MQQEDMLGDEHRLAELDRSGLMLSPADERYDRLTRLVSKALAAPVALISLVDTECQFFKSQIGLPEPWASRRQTPLSHSFCQYVVTTSQSLRVEDARIDARVSSNAAIRDLSVIAYLGVPIRSRSGYVLGSLCAIDNKPRKWSDEDESTLSDIAHIVENQIALDEDEKRWRQILNCVPQMVWSTQPDGFHDFYNDRWYEFTGVPHGSTDGEGWNGMFHPDDQGRAWERWHKSLSTGEPYEIEYRLRHSSGQYRWTLGRALPIRNVAGDIQRWFGTCTDINDLKEAEAARDLIGRELAHRIQNIFALITGLISVSLRTAPQANDFAASLSARIRALASAHRYLGIGWSPIDGVEEASGKTLRGLIEAIAAPYQRSTDGPTITVEGADAEIDEPAAISLALILHELATNAMKYGALAWQGGSIHIQCSKTDGFLVIEWRELGGKLQQAPTGNGFGSVLIENLMRQLGAVANYDWRPEGLTVAFSIPEAAMNTAGSAPKPTA